MPKNKHKKKVEWLEVLEEDCDLLDCEGSLGVSRHF